VSSIGKRIDQLEDQISAQEKAYQQQQAVREILREKLASLNTPEHKRELIREILSQPPRPLTYYEATTLKTVPRVKYE
jgi:signal recognition particle GTPase